ncbi:FAD-dependent oxidoreductase [Xanthobacter sp. V3C-3]|uniref:FAD-dependent oxidoreductase n=1 Tax=Xanthobacter lutulentifluminis TaxID=3119935 RepID=UPI0037275C0F
MTQAKANGASSGPAPRHVDFLLVGGGLASAVAAQTLRGEGATGSILILSAEDVPPYHHPPLSKHLLTGAEGAERIFVHPESFYGEHRIELALGARVNGVDPGNQTVTTVRGERIGYGQLLIATGAAPKTLDVPGASLPGIFSLRRKADADAIRAAIAEAKAAVVLGGSFLGMEIAMSLLDAGLKVTVIEQGPVLLRHLEAPDLSHYFERHAENRGVSVILNDTVVAVHGRGRVEEVETSAGRHVPCDLVVVSIGVTPATDFLVGSGITLEDGYVVVDALLRASAPNVFAAGDVTTFYDPVFARRRHIEHWDNAVKQGRLAARNMMGRRLRYDEVSYFFCEVGDIGFNVLGATEEADDWIARGALDEGSFALFYLKGDVPRALFSVGRPADETRVAEGLIRYRVGLGDIRERLNESTFVLDHIPTQTALILQGGGALGAFECGVVKALEEEGIFADIVAGVSIGALNGAVIAGNPRHASQALEAFWSDLAVATPQLPHPELRRVMAAAQILTLGVPNFFTPRWVVPPVRPQDWLANWTSFYDTAPVKALLRKYVDFAALKDSPVRLLVSAVDVTTATLEVFDSYVDDLTADHVLASGSLPPGFPWTMVGGKAYWDGGIISNSPLDLVIDRCGPDGKRVFVVDLFSGRRDLPTNMLEVLVRRDEIVYAERVRSDVQHRATIEAYRRLVEHILGQLEPARSARIKRIPAYIQLMGDAAATTITRFMRAGDTAEHATRDYDFSDIAIRANQAEGYAVAKKVLGTPSALGQEGLRAGALSAQEGPEAPQGDVK